MKVLAMLFSIVFLAGCGGSGGGGGDQASGGMTSPPEPVPKYVPYDTAHLVRVNAPLQVVSPDTPTGDDPGTIGFIDFGSYQPSHRGIDGHVIYNADTRDLPESESQRRPRFHGTHTSSLAAGRLVGVSPNSGLALIEAGLPSPGGISSPGTDEDFAEGIRLLRNKGVNILNLSTSSPDDAPGAYGGVGPLVVDAIQNEDWVLVLASGNESTGLYGLAANADAPEYDGHILVVGSVGGGVIPSPDGTGFIPDPDYKAISPFTNNATVEGSSPTRVIAHFIVAPGYEVCGAVPVPKDYVPGDNVPACIAPSQAQIDANGGVDPRGTDINAGYASLTGTSISTPIVSGAVALLRRARPDLNGSDIVKIILATATDGGAPGYDDIYGAGVLNVQAALDMAETYAPASSGKPAPSASRAKIVSSNTVVTAKKKVERTKPDSAIKVAKDYYMVPVTVDMKTGCTMFADWSSKYITSGTIFWQDRRGEFSMHQEGCLPAVNR